MFKPLSFYLGKWESLCIAQTITNTTFIGKKLVELLDSALNFTKYSLAQFISMTLHIRTPCCLTCFTVIMDGKYGAKGMLLNRCWHVMLL